MRLYNIYYICKQCLNIMSDIDIIKNLKFMHSSRTHYYKDYLEKVKEWEIYIEALITLRQVDLFSYAVNEFYNLLMLCHDNYDDIFNSSIEIQLDENRSYLMRKIEIFYDLYRSINDCEVGHNIVSEKGIDVKIPSCESLGEYISYLKEIDFIFTQCPFLKQGGARVKFEKTDVGSQWLTFVIAGAAGAASVIYILKNVALLVDQAIQIKSHLSSLKQQEEILRKQKIQNDILEYNQEIYKQLSQHYFDEAVKEIERENADIPLKDGEERGKLEKSLEKLCNLMDKGVEIYASIETSNEIQVLFPPLQDKAELPDSIIRYIEDKEKADSDEDQ